MIEPPRIFQSGNYADARGKLIFFNDFDMKEVRRFYVIEHPDTTVVRAWQGHKQEQKWFYVIAGSFKLVLVKPDDWENPSSKLNSDEFLLSSAEPKVLHVPGGFANGFKALASKSRIMVFSSFTVEESAQDHFRFDQNRWFDWK